MLDEIVEENTFLGRFALKFHFCQNNLGFIRWTSGTMPKPLGSRKSMSCAFFLGNLKILMKEFKTNSGSGTLPKPLGSWLMF